MNLRLIAALSVSALALTLACSDDKKGGDGVAPATLVVSALPADLYSGDRFAPTVTLQGANGAVLDVAREVTLSASGSTLAGTTTVTTVSGVATFSDVFFTTGGAGVTLTASSVKATDVTTEPGNVGQLVLAFAPAPPVGYPNALGPYDVKLTDSGITVLASKQRTVTLTAPSLAGDVTNDTASGIAHFEGLSVPDSVPSLVITATADGAAPVSVTVAAGYTTHETELADKSTVTNDTLETADVISEAIPAVGSLAIAADVDFYRFHALAGQQLQVFIYAGRMDQAAFSTNPEMKLFTAGGTLMQTANKAAYEGWSAQDYGFQQVLLPADGDYVISIGVEGGGVGGDYAVIFRLFDAIDGLQHEIEPPGAGGSNDTKLTAEPMTAGWLAGFHEGGDTFDYYRITVAANTRVQAELVSFRNGLYGNELDNYDPDILFGTASDDPWDDDDFNYYDSRIDFVVLTAGDYFIGVTRCCQDGSAPYLMHVTTETSTFAAEQAANSTSATASPLAYGGSVTGTSAGAEEHWFKFTAVAGDAVRVRPFDARSSQFTASSATYSIFGSDGLTEVTQTKDLGQSHLSMAILKASGDTFVRVVSAGPGTWGLMLENVSAQGMETEPNNDAGPGALVTTNTMPVEGRVAGVISDPADIDTYSFSAKANQLVTVSLEGISGSNNGYRYYRTYGSSLIAQLTILAADGTALATSLGSPTVITATGLGRSGAVTVAFVAPTSGTFYVSVKDQLGTTGSANAVYLLELRHNE